MINVIYRGMVIPVVTAMTDQLDDDINVIHILGKVASITQTTTVISSIPNKIKVKVNLRDDGELVILWVLPEKGHWISPGGIRVADVFIFTVDAKDFIIEDWKRIPYSTDD